MVFSGLVMAWRLATCPTSRSPVFVNATTDGVVRPPSWFAMTTGWPPSMTATTEFVVPKSIPIIFPMLRISSCVLVSAHTYYGILVFCCQGCVSVRLGCKVHHEGVKPSLRLELKGRPFRRTSLHGSQEGFGAMPSRSRSAYLER